MSTLEQLGMAFRLFLVALGFVAMWGLWRARDERRDTWTTKMKAIWLSHILFVCATVEANLELFYRHVQPTVAVILVLAALFYSIKGSFGDKYTRNQKP